MKEKTMIEICVDSLQSAMAAEKGGADRVELCSDLMAGGLTPSLGLVELVRERLSIDINVMIRPRAGDFCYSELEMEVMKRDINILKDKGINGIVLGVLRPNGDIDVEIMKELVELAKPIPITFHRAFDMTRNPMESLDVLIELGIKRILTSGKKNKAIDGMDLIKTLVSRSHGEIIIMPGAGINGENVTDIVEATGVKEIHLSARQMIESVMEYRNNNINMGRSSLASEYENHFTSEEVVQEIRKRLEK